MLFGPSLFRFQSSELPISNKVCPPLLVLSPSAERLHYALENHPTLKTISKLETMIMSCASETISLQETDSASANERLYNYRLHAYDNDHTLRELVICQNHQNNLAEGSLVATTHQSLISDFFSFSFFASWYALRKVEACTTSIHCRHCNNQCRKLQLSSSRTG